ncbi:MAG: MATE family efflux transporter [Clostridia bacterium]|nr:MATE family efflux transporter [Clostridia bacterium]
MDSEIFEKLPSTRLFFRLAIPSMITMVFGALYQIADGLFVGRFIGEDGLAAINLIMPVIMMVFAFSNMIATGASVRISILLGEKKREEASKVFSSSLKFIFILSIIIGIFGYVFAEDFIRFLGPGASELSIKYGAIYLRVYAVFSPLMLIFFATDNYLRVCGREKISMWISIFTQLFNIAMDVILIAFLGQGIWAAAFTSCFSMAIGSLFTLFLFRKKKMDVYYIKEIIPLKDFLKILANGSSEFFSNISMSVMSVAYNFFLLEYGGTTAVAAFSVIMYVDSIIGMLCFGMCDAISPAISYCYGANLLKKVRQLFNRVIISAIILSAAAMLFMLFLGRYVAPFFIKPEDTELLKISIIGMKFFSLSYLTGWVDMCFSSFFTSIERPARSLVISFFGTLFFPIAFLFILSPIWQLNGVWLTPLFSCTASGILAILLTINLKIKKSA